MVSAIFTQSPSGNFDEVLILIILEDGFCFMLAGCASSKHEQVLILIILEDGFCYTFAVLQELTTERLNPYYTGRWFLLELGKVQRVKTEQVLILIILEDGFCSTEINQYKK